MNKYLKDQALSIDLKIRMGDQTGALVSLQTVLERKVAREYRVEFAALARRLSRSEWGVALLRASVRPPARSNIKATDAEKSEYAACLIRLGALDEALTLLSEVSVANVPRSLLFIAFAHIARWNFTKSGEALTALLSREDIDEYDRLIAQVNLLVGLAFLGQAGAALKLAEQITAVTGPRKLGLLHSNALELAAQAAMSAELFDEARMFLREASRSIAGETIDAFFIQKSQAVLLYLSERTTRAREHLERVALTARTRSFWEQWRDCDYQLALHDDQVAARVYYGTPFENYRARLLEQRGSRTMPNAYTLSFSEYPTKFIEFSSLFRGVSARRFKAGQLQQRLLTTLVSDYYRPRRTLELFAALYPGDYYHPVSSPQRVHQAVKRLRATLREQSIPISVKEFHGQYCLVGGSAHDDRAVKGAGDRAAKGVAFVIGGLIQPPVSEHLKLTQLERVENLISKFCTMRADWFSVREFSEINKMPLRSASRTLSEAHEHGLVESRGGGRSRRYRCVGKAR